jgi:2-deoxy-D-gluconate 3-dehydrogenase
MSGRQQPGLFDLSGRVAVVTGGNGGIGLAMAKGLTDAGARVVIAARKRTKAEAALSMLRAGGAECLFVEVDVVSAGSCEAMTAETLERCGRLDILVNNAGVNIRRRPQDLEEAEWRRVLDVNLTGAFLCAKAAHPAMKRQGGGKIINIGSIYSILGAPLVAAYAASKGGLTQLTKALAAAWAQDNIQVNAVLPGWIDTDLTEVARAQIPELHEAVLARTPAGRWGQPEDLAGVTVFLAAPAADFVTGAAIVADGGYSMLG